MGDRDELLMDVLASVSSGDEKALERLGDDPGLRARFEELRTTAERIERAARERREVLGAAASQRVPLAEERLAAWVRAQTARARDSSAVPQGPSAALGVSSTRTPRRAEAFPWGPVLASMAAVLLAILGLQLLGHDRAADAGSGAAGDVRYLGSHRALDMDLQPRGRVPSWTDFSWKPVPLRAHESYRVLVYDAADEGGLIEESPRLHDSRWNVDPSLGASWPAKIRWELELVDEHGRSLNVWSAEAWRSP